MHRRKIVRLTTFDYIGEHRYSFTLCAAGRRPVFANPTVVSDTLSHFLRTAENENVEILVYCFMPDHLHLLICGLSAASDMMRFIRQAKQRSGFYYARQCGSSLWQRYSWDRVLRSDEDTPGVIRYILNNPVRAGLVEDSWSYPHWGSMRWSREEVRAMLAGM